MNPLLKDLINEHLQVCQKALGDGCVGDKSVGINACPFNHVLDMAPDGEPLRSYCILEIEKEVSERNKKFENDLTDLINKHCKENDSDTPDYILAEMLTDMMLVYSKIIRKRDKWYNFSHKPKTGIKFDI